MLRKNEDKILDTAIAAVRDESVDARQVEAAANRALALMREGLGEGDLRERIRSCADVRTRLAAHRAGQLSAAVALLIDDHLRECASCRAVADEREDAQTAALRWTPPAVGRRGRPAWQWLAAAAAVAVGVAVGLVGYQAWLGTPAGPRATVASATGALHALDSQGRLRSAHAGDALAEGESVRTARGGGALVTLADGSRVEMDERAQLSVSGRGSDLTLRLDRGNIIVKAAKRSRGHLYVATADCRVAVTGTVFSVSRGLAGSRVSVIEGEVHVTQAGHRSVLGPGQQLATTPALERVSVRDDVAWSRERDAHLALLAELQHLGERLETVSSPALRHESRLLSLVSEDTVVYVAIPNLGEAVGEGYALFKEHVASNPALRAWWERRGPGKDAPRLDDAVAKLRAMADYLGDEVVVALEPDLGRRPGGFLILAEIKKDGLRDLLASELATQGPGQSPPIRFLDREALAAAPTAGQALLVLETDGILAATTDLADLRRLGERLVAGAGSFVATPFGRRVREAYEGGAGVLVAADLGRLGGPAARRGAHAALTPPRYLVAERKTLDGRTVNSAVLAFVGPRSGVASWLAAPAPIGSLEFVSAQAAGAVAFVLRNPAALFDELLVSLGERQANAAEALSHVEAELNLRLRDDLIQALGGELALALDGPVLPQPAWKVIVEVNDPERLMGAVTTLVEAAGAKMAERGKGTLRLTEAQLGEGREHILAVTGGRVPFEVHFTFVDGYLVAAPTRALVVRALQTRNAGASLAQSSDFAALMPIDGSMHCSGIVYQNLGLALGPLASTLGESGSLSPEAQRSLAAIAERSRPSLVALYGEEDRIRVAATGTLPGFDPSALALPQILGRALPGTRTGARP